MAKTDTNTEQIAFLRREALKNDCLSREACGCIEAIRCHDISSQFVEDAQSLFESLQIEIEKRAVWIDEQLRVCLGEIQATESVESTNTVQLFTMLKQIEHSLSFPSNDWLTFYYSRFNCNGGLVLLKWLQKQQNKFILAQLQEQTESMKRIQLDVIFRVFRNLV
jgi:hypothetical protein